MIDTDTLKAKTDLLALARRDTALRGKDKWYCGPCPFCGGYDRFVLKNTPEGWRWYCRNCSDSQYQDPIAYVMRRESCDFRRACDLLGAGDDLPARPHAALPTPKPTEPSPAEWRAAARRVIELAEQNLLTERGAKARSWLYQRGLTDTAVRRWHIGLVPGKPYEWRGMAGLRVPCGILIPCEIAGVIWYLKVRRAAGTPKYRQVKGSVPALFGAETLRGHDVAVICEGEFDAILLHQEAGDLAGVATLGSATGGLDLAVWGNYLLPVPRLLVAYDLDGAGKTGAAKLAGLTARARRVSVPAMPNVKDLTDFWKAGGNLRAWLSFELARRNLP
jgi:DNA primase